MVTDFQGEKIEHDVSFMGMPRQPAASGRIHYQIRRDYVYFLAVGLVVFLDGPPAGGLRRGGLAGRGAGPSVSPLKGSVFSLAARFALDAHIAIMLRIETTLLGRPPRSISSSFFVDDTGNPCRPDRRPSPTRVAPCGRRRDHLLTALHLPLTLRGRKR